MRKASATVLMVVTGASAVWAACAMGEFLRRPPDWPQWKACGFLVCTFAVGLGTLLAWCWKRTPGWPVAAAHLGFGAWGILLLDPAVQARANRADLFGLLLCGLAACPFVSAGMVLLWSAPFNRALGACVAPAEVLRIRQRMGWAVGRLCSLRLTRRQTFLALACALFLGAWWQDLHRSEPVDSPESAVRIVRTQFRRNMWLHLPQDIWELIEMKLEANPAPLVTIMSEENRRWAKTVLDDPELCREASRNFRYGGPRQLAKPSSPLWIVTLPGGIDSTWHIALRQADGRIVAVICVPEG